MSAATTALSATDWSVVWNKWMGLRTETVLPPWVKLPALSSALLEFIEAAQQPGAGPAELGRVVERDAGLTCLLLRHVNSAASGARERVGSAREALVRLGIRGAILYLIGAAMNDVLRASRSRLMDLNGFWCANLERALFARNVAGLLGADGELAFTGALVSDCLLPWLTNSATQTYLRFLSSRQKAPASLIAFESEEFGWNHAEACACLLAGWKFPLDVTCCVLLHHRGLQLLQDTELRGTAAAAVALAGLLPDQLRQEPAGLSALKCLERKWPAFHLETLVRSVETEFEEMNLGITNRFPLSRRLVSTR
ncbi:MAG: HDOD domain-containing protein [Planctomycetes bacterium]|nr:HDOD domain-containing protein [Planctomycetota bacterium]